MTEPDVHRLREDAARRARSRPVAPFAGRVHDTELGEGPVTRAARWYCPDSVADVGDVVVFLHGGYGILGGLDLQDGYCRRIATALGIAVLAVDYRLAPEHPFTESVADAVAAVAAARSSGAARVLLWGDSAGGAVALQAARLAAAEALVLSNPNVDLSLAGYDATAPGGPDAALSAWAFERWTGAPLDRAPDLAADVSGLPPLFMAVGSADALLPDAIRLVRARGEAGLRAELLIIAGAAHGFMSGPDDRAIASVLSAARDFTMLVPPPSVEV
jgi:acetyl esterase